MALAVAVADSQLSSGSVSVALAVNWFCYDVLRGWQLGRRGTRTWHMIYGQLDCWLTGWSFGWFEVCKQLKSAGLVRVASAELINKSTRQILAIVTGDI